jgi:pimeloyl-ACP methyl ester carboxylesterase
MQLSANGIAIEVEDHGPTNGEPLLLIMGLGMQLIAWPDDLVQRLVAAGFRVIRFDNRDVGLSQGFDELGVPNLAWAGLKYTMRLPVAAPYGLHDMAGDAVGVLDALGIARAHVCGVSMGGMIAQQLAARHPQRVKSQTLVMTTSGARHLPQARPHVRRALISRPPRGAGRDGVVSHLEAFLMLIGSPGFPSPPAQLRHRVEMAVHRAWRPAGSARQLLAVAADGDRSPLLSRMRIPTHVMHGREDPLVPCAAAHDLQSKIDGATLDLIDGMGHDLPVQLMPRLAQGIADNASKA